MKFPSQALRQTVLVRSAGEDLGDGPSWGAWLPLRCRVDTTNQLVRGATGADIFRKATILCRPDQRPGHADPATLHPGDEVDIDGDIRTLHAVDATHTPGGRVAGYELVAT